MVKILLYKAYSNTDSLYDNPDWGALASKFGFKIIKVGDSVASVNASVDAISSLQRAHPEIRSSKEQEFDIATNSKF
jgi:hypothetical protein